MLLSAGAGVWAWLGCGCGLWASGIYFRGVEGFSGMGAGVALGGRGGMMVWLTMGEVTVKRGTRDFNVESGAEGSFWKGSWSYVGRCATRLRML